MRFPAAACCLVALLAGRTEAATLQPESVQNFLAEHCLACHAADEPSGGLNLTTLAWVFDTAEAQRRWIQIFDRVLAGEMPPESELDLEQRQILTGPLQSALLHAIQSDQAENGRTTLRRLNRREFQNSLHELLGVETEIEHLLPEDGRAGGFDTVAEGLRISAVQLEKYLEGIDLALDDAIRLTERPEGFNKRLRLQDEREIRENLDRSEDYVDPVSGARHRRLFRELDNAVVYISHGYSPDHLKQFSPSADGLYRVRISAYSIDSRGGPIALRVSSSDWKSSRLLHYFNLVPNEPRTLELNVRLTTREHLRISGYGIGIDEAGKSVWNVDSVADWKVPAMAVEWVEIEGPLLEQWPPASVANLFGAESLRPLERRGRWTPQGRVAYELAPEDAQAATEEALVRFATQAFRRPLEAGGADRFVQLARAELVSGRSYEQAMRVGLRSILVSPRFLLLDESVGQLDDYQLASRLSYCLWSGPPDRELLELANLGKLTDGPTLQQQIERMLNSPRSEHFVRSFVGQWLDLNQIDATTPDAQLYPEYDDLLRDSMIAETQNYFRLMLTENLSIANVIDSDFAMLDRRTAEHYGLGELVPDRQGELFGEQFRRVPLPPDSVRGGILTQASVLKVTANGTVTSPVLRGAWILRKIVGQPPSPPPPVNAIEPDTRGATTIREQLAKHRDVDTCNRCHREIDPPGFALESFDVIGGFRQRYRSVGAGDPPTDKLHGRNIWEYKLGLPIDCSGQTADGKYFADIRDFKQLLRAEQTQVVRCVTEKMLTYATGAAIGFADREEVERIVQQVESQGGGLRTLVHEVLSSPLFLRK